MKSQVAAIALTLGAAVAASAAGPVQVPIALESFAYSPNPIVLRAGQPVTLILTNRAGIGHEFKAPGFFRSARILAGPVDPEGAVDLRQHQSAEVTLIPARGTFAVHCGHFMHKQLGMRTLIYVE